MRVLIGQQVCFHSTVRHENDVINMVGMQSLICENLQFHEI